MKNKELLTIIIPSYNNTNIELKRSIESIIKQKKINFKILILIIDDNSKIKINLKKLDLIKFDRKKFLIKVYSKKKNQGDSSARVTGVNLAKSKYVAFLDADDYWLQSKLFYQMNFLKKYKKKIVGTDWNNKTHFSKFFSRDPKYYKINKIQMALKWWPHISTILIEKPLFKKLRLHESQIYRYGGDGDLLIKLASSNNFFVLSKNLVKCHSFKSNPFISGMSSKMREMNSGEIRVIKKNFKNILVRFGLVIWIKVKFLLRVGKYSI